MLVDMARRYEMISHFLHPSLSPRDWDVAFSNEYIEYTYTGPGQILITVVRVPQEFLTLGNPPFLLANANFSIRSDLLATDSPINVTQGCTLRLGISMRDYSSVPEYMHSMEERRAAREKSKNLLESFLDTKQKRMYRETEIVVAIGGKTKLKYYILPNEVANIIREDTPLKSSRYCLAVGKNSVVPLADIMLAQILMIQCNEDQFLATANHIKNDLPANTFVQIYQAGRNFSI